MNKIYVLLRYGDLMLKGKNRPFFIKTVNKQIRNKLSEFSVEYDFQHDRIVISFLKELYEQVVEVLHTIPGLHSFSIIRTSSKDWDEMINCAKLMIDEEITRETTFKVETRRTDKTYPLTSPEFSMKFAKELLPLVNNVKVDVRNPEVTLTVNIRNDVTYFYLTSHLLMGGFPSGIAGKGLLLLSGGIDSPVAAYLAMKQGIEVELFHFESTPLTPIEAAQKTIDIAKRLSVYSKNNEIKLHMVPFFKMHEQLLFNVDEKYTINVMRRMMYRIADVFSRRRNFLAIINGDSVGQVASQTLHSMNVVSSVTNQTILRPLITYDKTEIIKISKDIKVYDISILPFNDCCSIYVPKNPIINPKEEDAVSNENKFNYEEIIDETIQGINTIKINKNTNLTLANYGLTVPEALAEYKEKI